ncbi:hypothetical protein [Haloferula sp.]|uniref:hypothetical protein n=1 Tax=Haloferula sp. TaxID=2497595 RepID=UPI00329D5A97
MKISVLLFLVGLALGVAGMLVIRPAASEEKRSGNARDHHADDSSGHRLSPPTRETKSSRRSARRRADRSDPRTSLEELLTTLSTIGDESQLDMMLLIRHASMLTRLNESEAIDLLQHLAQPVADDDFGEREEFNEIASAIIFTRLCELNGPEAMRMASAGELMEGLDEDVTVWGMNSWIAADPEGAQRWYEGIMKDADAFILKGDENATPPAMMMVIDNDETRRAYFNGMAKHDPEALEESINQFESDDVRNAMRADLMISLVGQETQAEGLVDILNKSTEHNEARGLAIEKLSELDPDQAVAWIETQPAGKSRDNEINTVASTLMDRDSESGIDWYMSQQMHDPEREKDRLSRITYHLARDDSTVAAQWVEQQPDNATRDHAELAMAWTYANQKDWDSSMAWVAGVENQSSRDDTLNKIFERGWNREEGALQPEILSAAEAAGFGDAAGAYKRN